MALSLLKPRICELGKIKIGGLGEARQSRSGGTYRAPVKLDHFILTTLSRGKDGDLEPDKDLMSGLAPLADPDGYLRQLPISLLSNEIEDIIQASWVLYEGKKLVARCEDGVNVERLLDAKGEKLATPKIEPWREGAPGWKLHTTFSCVISAQKARWGGYYKLRTTSRITADQLYGSLVQLRALTGGILRGLPLQLVVRPIMVSPDGKPTTVYVVHCEMRGADISDIQRLALERARFETENARAVQAAQAEYRALLTAPSDMDDIEEAEVGQEFHPSAVVPPLPDQEPATTSENTPTAGDLAKAIRGAYTRVGRERVLEVIRPMGWESSSDIPADQRSEVIEMMEALHP